MRRESTPLTTFLLVRHGAFDGIGRSVSGRIPGLGLNAVGRAYWRKSFTFEMQKLYMPRALVLAGTWNWTPSMRVLSNT